MDKEMLKAIKEILQEELKPINNRLERIEIKQEEHSKILKEIEPIKKDLGEIKEIVVELEPKNANRHLEINNSIDDLRKDLVNVEIITGSNWVEIAKLKKIK